MMEDMLKLVKDATVDVLKDVYDERRAQDQKWGEQNHPDFIPSVDAFLRNWSREQHTAMCNEATKARKLTWEHILLEESAEAMACGDDVTHLRRELIQVAAVCVAWVEAIDRRSRGGSPKAS